MFAAEPDGEHDIDTAFAGHLTENKGTTPTLNA
jgi:hypothetical protein